MVPAAQWDSELIAYLASERWVLDISQMMGIRGLSTANQTGLLGNRFQVESVASTARLWESQQALVNHLGSRPILWPSY